MEKRIKIFDTTLRDGEQAPGFSMNLEEKLRLALQLEKLGVDVIEGGFPIASNGDFEAVKEIAESISDCQVAGLCRTKFMDIDRAGEALKNAIYPRIHTFIATSDIHLKYKLKKTRLEALNDAVKAVKHARSFCQDVEFSAEDASRSDPEYLCDIFTAVIEAGATVINVPDTVGYSLPWEFGQLIAKIKQDVNGIKNVTISVHCHNDLGLAVANSLAAIENGARQVECTINGIGERAGNAALEEIVMALQTRHDHLGLSTNVNTKEIYRSSKLLSLLTGMTVQRNKAIVGANAFAHEAGIHQHGMLNNSMTYEIMTPESVGVPQSTLVLGKHSGRHALAKRYQELGFSLIESELNTAYLSFTKLADKKKDIYDADLIAIMQNGKGEFKEKYILENMHVISGTAIMPTATIRLRDNENLLEDSSVGDGPVDAAFRAIDRIVGQENRLTSYSVNSISKGKDAMGEVLLQIERDGISYVGKATSTDVVEASAKAYLKAINRAECNGKKETVEMKEKMV